MTDLDGTLLRSDKTVSSATCSVLKRCRAAGYLLGIATARILPNALRVLEGIEPDLIISSGGALITHCGRELYRCAFSVEETKAMLSAALSLQCEITVDTVSEHYWNYTCDPSLLTPDWCRSVYSDFRDFNEEALKICVQISDEGTAERIAASVPDCDYAKFSDVDFYKFTKKGATKEKAAQIAAKSFEIAPEELIAFGDDMVDLEMLRFCGRGIAMENAIGAVKEIADAVTDTNDCDGVAKYLEEMLLTEKAGV